MNDEMHNKAMNETLLSIGGVYLHQSHAFYVDYTTDYTAEETKLMHQLLENSELTDWREIAYTLTSRHEENHFLNHLVSPTLAFVDDLNDIYMSTCAYLLQDLSREMHGPIQRPLVLESTEGLLKECFRERVECLCRLKRAQNQLLFWCDKIGDVVDRLNYAIDVIALSKGIRDSELGRVVTKLPEDLPIAPDKFTTLHILEALARLIEFWSLSELKAKPQVIQSWQKAKLWGPYVPGLARACGPLGQDLGTLALNLSLRGPFFPFSEPREFLLEDFHPVLLLPRIVNFFENEFRVCKIKPSDTEQFSDYCCQLAARAIRKFDLVEDVSRFSANQEALEIKFKDEFPEIYSSPHYKRYLQDRAHVQRKRVRYYKRYNEDPLCVFEQPVVTVDKFFTKDNVIGCDIDFLKQPEEDRATLTQYDVKLYGGTLADWVLFNDESAMDLAGKVIRAVAMSSGRHPPDNPKEYLLKHAMISQGQRLKVDIAF